MDIGNTEIDALNRKLSGEYVTIDGHKIFRLVWSESIFENRYGTFREFTESGIFVREVTEVRRVRKYNYIHNRWIFEIWAPGNVVANPETPDAINGDYVPVYVFEDRGGMYLPPNEKVVRFLIASLHGKVRRDERPSLEYLEEREINSMVESMEDHPAWFQTRPGSTRNAIWYSGGVPEWRDRRATFFNEGIVNLAERKAIAEQRAIEALKMEQMDLEIAKTRAVTNETITMAERRRDLEIQVERIREQERESLVRRMENLKQKEQKIKDDQPQSPMHHE